MINCRHRSESAFLWPYSKGDQRIVLELKINRSGRKSTIENALPQIAAYMDRCGATEGHLILFHQHDLTWEEKIFNETAEHAGCTIQVWGM
jgi:hypothetical protein